MLLPLTRAGTLLGFYQHSKRLCHHVQGRTFFFYRYYSKTIAIAAGYQFKIDDFIFDFVAELLKDYSQDKLTPEILDASLCFLIAKLLQASQVKTLNHSLKNKILVNYRKQIEDSFKVTRDVKVYAEKLNITTAKLNETCTEILGKTAYDLLKERVFLEAKILLTHTNDSVKEIAYELNFTDPSYFVKYFKSQSNLTPKKYREMVH